MFKIPDLNKKYQYNYSSSESILIVLSSNHLDKKDVVQVVAFINLFITANEWEWNSITYFACKKIEFLIQEKLPLQIADKQEIYFWIISNWQKFSFPELDKVGENTRRYRKNNIRG